MNIKNKTAGHAGIACFSFALKGNRAGSPHFKIVRFKWWEHVTTATNKSTHLHCLPYGDALDTPLVFFSSILYTNTANIERR